MSRCPKTPKRVSEMDRNECPKTSEICTVPWKYSFSQVEVLPKERTVEIYSNGELIASHPLSYQKRSLVYLPHQYKGIESEAGRLAPPVTVRQIIDTSVEIRSLDEYVEAASARS